MHVIALAILNPIIGIYGTREILHNSVKVLYRSLFTCLHDILSVASIFGPSHSPMILPPVSSKELHRDTERMVTELHLYTIQFCS